MRKTGELNPVDVRTTLNLPLYEIGLYAGFPSPAQDYAAIPINLNVALMLDTDNTRIVKIQDNDLSCEHIYEGDLAIIATNLTAEIGDKIYCHLDGEYMCRIVAQDETSIILITTNKKTAPIRLSKESGCFVNGVITYTITKHIPSKFNLKNKNEPIDINKLLIKNKAATFFGFINGDSMKEAGIHDGDLAIIDKSLPYTNGYKALCRIDNRFTVKYIEWDKKDKETLWLKPANKDFQPIKIENDESVTVWGIITHTITPHTRKFNIP